MMSGDEINQTRRTVLQAVGLTGSLSAIPAVSAAKLTSDTLSEQSLGNVALEAASHPSEPVIAFTAITEDEGFQLYIANGIESISDRVSSENIIQVTNAEAGVHGLQWSRNQWLTYSVDNRTVKRQIRLGTADENVVGSEKIIDNEPRSFKQDIGSSDVPAVHAPDVPYPIDCKDGANVCCTDIPYVNDWCVRVDLDEDPSHSPRCSGRTVPRMDHAHIAVYPSGDDESGINIWSGYDGRCVWLGEENYTNWCTTVCAPNSGEMPSVSDLRDAFEDLIERALNAAGIAAPGVVIVALAYFLAVTTVTPPFPGVPVL